MPLSDMNLGKGEVLLTQSASVYGFAPIDNSILFGTIALVSDLSDKFTVGQSVLFDPLKCSKIRYGSTIYYKVKEDSISGGEVTPT